MPNSSGIQHPPEENTAITGTSRNTITRPATIGHCIHLLTLVVSKFFPLPYQRLADHKVFSRHHRAPNPELNLGDARKCRGGFYHYVWLFSCTDGSMRTSPTTNIIPTTDSACVVQKHRHGNFVSSMVRSNTTRDCFKVRFILVGFIYVLPVLPILYEGT